jgi:hypothetical protein
MIQQTEPTTNSRRLQVDETEKVSSTICCQVAGFVPLHQPRIVPGDIGVSRYQSVRAVERKAPSWRKPFRFETRANARPMDRIFRNLLLFHPSALSAHPDA